MGDGQAFGGRSLVLTPGAGDLVIESSDVDTDTLDDGGQATVLAAFGRLCRALEMRVQITVLTRRSLSRARDEPDESTALGVMPTRLAGERRSHWRRVDAHYPAFSRRILFTARAADADHRMRALTGELIRSTLEAAGLAHHELTAREKDDLVTAVAGPPCCDGPSAAPRRWSETRDHARVDAVLLRGAVLASLPGAPVHEGWMRPLMTVRADCDVALWLSPVPLDAAVRLLGRRLRTLRSDQLLRADRGVLDDAFVDSGHEAAHALRARLAANHSRPLELSVAAVARGHDDDSLTHANGLVRSAFRACLTTSSPSHFHHLDTARACWPMGNAAGLRGKLIDSTAAATCAPWAQTTCEDANGYRLGRAQHSGLPIALAPFDTAAHANGNIVVLARSGQGKSFTIGTLVIEAAVRGVESIIIDPEGEYAGLVKALGGQSLRLAPGSGAALNVFDIAGSCEGAAGIGEAQRRSGDLLAILVDGALTLDERRLLDAAVAAAVGTAATHHRIPVLGDCLPALPADGRLATALHRFCSGPIGKLFSRPTTIPLDRGIVNLDMRELSREFVAPATFIVAEWLWALIRRSRRRRHLIFDEVGLLYEHASLRQLLVQLARRCRKYDTSLIVATQNAGDLLRSADGTVVATNPSIALLGGHRGAEVAAMEAAFSLTRGQRRHLEAAGRGEFLLLAGNRRLAIQVEVPRAYHDLLTRR